MSVPGFGGSGSQVDSARMNLASSFVNGFVNAAFGQDKLLTDDGNKWLYKNKDHGEVSPAVVANTMLSCGWAHCGLPHCRSGGVLATALQGRVWGKRFL